MYVIYSMKCMIQLSTFFSDRVIMTYLQYNRVWQPYRMTVP